jgi:hypothetical protein
VATKRLSKLKASEVSLVNRGAIKRPFLIYKNEEGIPMAEKRMSEILTLTPAQEDRIDAAIAKHASAVAKDDEAMPLDERAQAALKAVYRILLPFKDQITEDMVDELIAELDPEDDEGDDDDDLLSEGDIEPEEVLQSADNETDPTEENDNMKKKADWEDMKKGADWAPKKPDGMDEAKHQAAVDSAKAAYSKACGAAAKAADDEDDDGEPFEEDKKMQKSAVSKAMNGVPAEHRAIFEAVQKAAEADKRQWVEKAASMEAEIRAMKDEKILKAYEEQVGVECQTLGLDVSKTARVLKSLSGSDQEAHDHYLETLRTSARSATGTGIFKSHGVSPNASASRSVASNANGSAKAQLEAMVNGFVAKGEAPSESAAWAAVLKSEQGIRLYEQAAKEGGI